ncbi:cytochrome c biogenesis CcdA family protein [Dechloromonas sp. ARDL1]|uniref:cytochrome c biogenesis CcdA family protein n=1 Tax=Dechloromonas sp. ARDL1 TaxID=3322121 RepID=UPI003DA73E82
MDSIAEWLTPWLQSGSPLLIPLVLLGGLATALNPCCLPMYPAALGYLGQAGLHPEGGSRSGRIAFAFIAGMASATTAMGAVTASLGWVFGQMPVTLRLLLASVPLIMGLDLLGVVRLHPTLYIPWLSRASTLKQFVPRMGRAFMVGFLFTLAIAPCATPILIGILSAVAMNGSPSFGAALMFLYGLGAGLPLLAIARGAHLLGQRLISSRARRVMNAILGGMLVALGLFLVWQA